ncbi:MAG: hypothetical protein KKD97_16110 [Gammaproteobacteria bacterium]|nr:hypothetical protein [Gammaproteobacteria bacterium]
MPKPDWAEVKLRVAWGEIPEFSDVLELASGRRYQVIGVRGKTLRCIVLPSTATTDGCRVIPWQWSKRTKKARHHG